jgi:hypothetical protein
MPQGDKHNCLDFDFAYAALTIVRLRDGKWARVIAAPMKNHPDVEQERYTVIDRCPWCNKKLETT